MERRDYRAPAANGQVASPPWPACPAWPGTARMSVAVAFGSTVSGCTASAWTVSGCTASAPDAVSVASQRQVAAGGRVEDVDGPGVHPELGVLALADAGGGVEPGDDRFAAGAARASRVPGQFFELGGAHALVAPVREVDEHVGAQGLQDVDVGAERDPVRAVVRRDQRRVLEVLRPQAHDDVAPGPGRSEERR